MTDKQFVEIVCRALLMIVRAAVTKFEIKMRVPEIEE